MLFVIINSVHFILDGQLQLKISSDQYIHRGPQENIIVKYYLHCQVKQTDQIFLRDDSISFQRDDFLKPVSVLMRGKYLCK